MDPNFKWSARVKCLKTGETVSHALDYKPADPVDRERPKKAA